MTLSRRFGPMISAFLFGLPLGTGLLCLLRGPLQATPLGRYVEHPAECVLVVIFGCALGVFIGKLLGVLSERAASSQARLPAWDGKTVPVTNSENMLTSFKKLPGWVQASHLGSRIAAVLVFLTARKSANELDDQLRCLADTDAMNLEASYSLTRFISWAMPILGFLGTVLGITAAISGVDPSQLEQNIGQVTGGLAEAFDTTALALGLTMVVMFFSFVVERAEHRMLGGVDLYVEEELAHRFERTGAVGGELIEVLREQGSSILKTTELLVQRQAAVWAKALEEANGRRKEMEADFKKQLAAGVDAALEKTLDAHSRRLGELQHQASGPTNVLVEKLGTLAKTAEAMSKQTEALGRLQEGERQLVQLQQLLQQNLASLADAGSFQQAVHSLTAAIHLMTAQMTAHIPASTTMRRPGAAA
jgi:biopolymer transport protein ExbB/TolQ